MAPTERARDMQEARSAPGKMRLTQERALLALSAVATVAILFWMLNHARYGFDFTDESFYLTWTSNPFLYDWSMTQFGFVYHPLHLALDGDIASLRQANVGVTFLLAWCLTGLVLHESSAGETRSLPALVVVSAGFSVASLVTFYFWLISPNYNTLTFQSLLIASMGMVLADRRVTTRSVLGWVLVGVGGWLTFMAKPSTALALAFGALLFLLFSRKFSFRLLSLAVSVALGLLVVSALVIDGSIHGFVGRLQTGLAFYALLEGGHTPAKSFRVDGFHLGHKEKLVIQLTTTLAFIGAWFASLERSMLKWFALVLSGGFLIVTLATLGDAIHFSTGFGEFQNLVIWSIVFACAGLLLVTMRERLVEHLRPSHLALALLFSALPHIYAFGSNSSYWRGAGFVCMFWLLAGIVLLGPVARARGEWRFALPLVFATQALSALLLQTGFNNPYRQPQSLRANDTVVAVAGEGSSPLVLSADYASYVNAARRAAKEAGFTPGTPLIDLTGQSPGILYALQARSIGQAWTVGGYPGSNKLAEAALARVPCEQLSAAWLLVEDAGPRSLSSGTVMSYGASFQKDYELVAAWRTAPGAGGYADPREQKLFKPLNTPFLLMECRKRVPQPPLSPSTPSAQWDGVNTITQPSAQNEPSLRRPLG